MQNNINFFTFQQLLIEKFREFARDTMNTGSERVAATNAVCDQLIGTGHSDAATIAEWKDQINESWADLLELIETRTKVNKICCSFFIVLLLLLSKMPVRRNTWF